MLSLVEQTRLRVSQGTDSGKKSSLGQFFTSEKTAAFMASLFSDCDSSADCVLLDAGAGIGSLSAAFLERWKRGDFQFERVNLDAFEIDASLQPYLSETLEKYSGDERFSAKIRSEDFIRIAVESLSGRLLEEPLPKYTHAILNPPYKKINSKSSHRQLLRRVGIETVNLYSAFVALAVALAAPSGQIVAITPRSFCNGPYYRRFRDFILEHAAIRHIHLFESRNKAFKDDSVLQENVIMLLERGGTQGMVTVSTSTDNTFSDLATHEHPFDRIVFPDDSGRFIHVPTSPEKNAIEQHPSIRCTLNDLGVNVSTGPVVDFRVKEHLRNMPEAGTVPLLYPKHFASSGVTWPIADMKKSNAIVRNVDTEKWLYPKGFYCVVRRFSSKEENRRIIANVVDPGVFGDVSMFGFENHLNVFHENKNGLHRALAYGLALFLNTTAVDEHFRRFSGHTQVNATDLKLMKYPSRNALIKLGEWAMTQGEELTQDMIDTQLETLIE